MIMRWLIVIAVCCMSLAACSSIASKRGGFGDHAKARLIDRQGARIGEVAVWQGAKGVLITISAEALTPGMHGVHMHAKGDCSDHDVFKKSGGHVRGAGGAHGFLHPEGVHGGDLPNVYAHEGGLVRAHFFSTRIMLADLQDQDGAALIIHESPDDYQTQPIGGAGARVACAVFSARQ